MKKVIAEHSEKINNIAQGTGDRPLILRFGLAL